MPKVARSCQAIKRGVTGRAGYRRQMAEPRRLAVVVALVWCIVALGCGGRCKDVARARDALAVRDVPADRTDVEVLVPLAEANTLIAALLAARPLTVPLELGDVLPSLGPVALGLDRQLTHGLAATAREVRVLPAGADRLRFAIELVVADDGGEVTTLAIEAEVTPQLVRIAGERPRAELQLGLSPGDLRAVKPQLPADQRARLGAAVRRWAPARLRDKLPPELVDAAAHRLGQHLTGKAFDVLRDTLLARVGEVSRLRLRLPDVPVARTHLHTRQGPDVLVIDVVTDLPIRAGLDSEAAVDSPDAVTVRIAGSAAAELANWAIDQGHAPRWYTRSLTPSPSGEFRPRFDWRPGASHPIEVYAFQERGGCSYFQVGVRARIAVERDQLVVTALDRELVAMAANPVIEVAAWVKYFLTGALDRSKRIAASTELTIGGRPLSTRVATAALRGDELAFGLAFAVPVR